MEQRANDLILLLLAQSRVLDFHGKAGRRQLLLQKKQERMEGCINILMDGTQWLTNERSYLGSRMCRGRKPDTYISAEGLCSLELTSFKSGWPEWWGVQHSRFLSALVLYVIIPTGNDLITENGRVKTGTETGSCLITAY